MGCNCAHAAWVELIKVPNQMSIYTDPTTLSRKGDIVTQSVLYNLATPQKAKDDKLFLSTIKQSEYDCKENKGKAISLTWYDKNMGEGAVVFAVQPPPTWKAIPADSPFLIEMKTACEHKQR